MATKTKRRLYHPVFGTTRGVSDIGLHKHNRVKSADATDPFDDDDDAVALLGRVRYVIPSLTHSLPHMRVCVGGGGGVIGRHMLSCDACAREVPPVA